MTLLGWKDEPRIFSGEILFTDVQGDGQFSIRDAIEADIMQIFPGHYVEPFAAAAWGLSIKIKDYNANIIKRIAGIPLRGQFGSITYFTVATYLQSQYIQHLFQTFAMQRCITHPIDYADVGYEPSSGQFLVEYDAYSTVSGFLSTLGIYASYDSFHGATGFAYDLAESVTANMVVQYVGKYAEQYPNTSNNRVVVINT